MLDEKLPRGNCAVCGKNIPVRDIRSNKAQYCSRPHAALARFSTRYRGTNSGPADRPRSLLEKSTKL